MDENALPKPRMPQIKNFPFLGPVGVMLSSCTIAPEHISHWARTARGPVAYNFPRPATSLPSPRLAVCTIATSVEPLKGKRECSWSHPSNCNHVSFEQGQDFYSDETPYLLTGVELPGPSHWIVSGSNFPQPLL